MMSRNILRMKRGFPMNTEFRHKYDGMSAEEVAASLKETIAESLHARYGPTPDAAIVKRVQEEWAAMEASGGVEDVAALHELTLWLKERREPYWVRGTPGASLILYLLGITAGNPLPPHYYCPRCHSVIWRSDCADGFDLPTDLTCEKDGALLCGDGHNIPWPTHWGYGKEPEYVFDVSEPLTETLWAFFQGHWLSRLRPEVEIIHRHPDADPRFMGFSRLWINCRLDPSEISPDFYNIMPDASCIPNAMRVHRAFLETAKPNPYNGVSVELFFRPVYTFADIIAKISITSSTCSCDEDAQFMVERLGYSLSDLITCRDDIFFYLLSHGFSEKDAWYGMDSVRRGRGLPVITSEMSLARDKWVIDRCERVKYLFSKAHAIEYIFYRLRAEKLLSHQEEATNEY